MLKAEARVKETSARFNRPVTSARLRDHFLEKIIELGHEVKGRSAGAWAKRLVIDGEQVDRWLFEGITHLTTKSRVLNKLVIEYAKAMSFNPQPARRGSKVYMDSFGNTLYLHGGILAFNPKIMD
jgi:hypothetical protein